MAARERFLKEFPKAVADDAAAIFVGAGVSIGAGYPSWKELLQDIGEELGVRSSDVLDLAALAQWSISRSAGKTRILTVIRNEVGADKPVPVPLEVIARLPIRNIWTTNYDRLIERAFGAIGRPIDTISASSDLAIRTRPGAARLYKMHGSVDRLDDIVISTDDYELYRNKRGAFLPLLQAHMTSFSILFVGLSFTDPNIRHVLSLIRETFHTAPPEHFAIVRPPHRAEYLSDDEFNARLTQHNLWAADLLRYGLQVVEIDRYDEVPELLQDIERRVATNRVWVSGSWPMEDNRSSYAAEIAMRVGHELGSAGFDLVSGSGVTISAAAVSGFLDALQRAGSWDLERRLLVRPFPQPVTGARPNQKQWEALRAEMARVSGAIVFIGGAKLQNGELVESEGVLDERAAADRVGAFLLPVGASGGAAKAIAEDLIGSSLPFEGIEARRPSDAELRPLLREKDPGKISNLVIKILRRFSNLRG
jgi:Sir2- and TIR-associating SLOG family/SIR2-like domain